MQHLPSNLQKQADIVRNSGSTHRAKLQACIYILDEGKKANPELKEKLKEFIRSESINLFGACVAILDSLDAKLAKGDMKTKLETKMTSKVKQVLNTLPRILTYFPAENFKELQLESLHKIIINVFQTGISMKYRRNGFALLMKYVRIAISAGHTIDSVFAFCDARAFFPFFITPCLTATSRSAVSPPVLKFPHPQSKRQYFRRGRVFL